MFALIDANNFYASCEQIFRPDLKNKPLIVLSNNDGCVIACSAQAKALGIQRGMPYFKIKKWVESQHVHVFSSNYGLYGDISRRIMQILKKNAPAIEIYSIDECFADVSGIADLQSLGQQWQKKVKQGTGINVSIGFAQTKTLAKLANYAAKKWSKTQGVMDLSDPQRQCKLLQITPVNQIWGIGHRLSEALSYAGIHTAYDLANQEGKLMRRRYSLNVEKTIDELNGQSCISLDQALTNKKQIISSRSFSQAITQKAALEEALIEYAAIAGEKMRMQGLGCQQLKIYASTSQHANRPYIYKCQTIYFQRATCDTRDFAKKIMENIEAIYQENTAFIKAGVMLSHLSALHGQQIDLFNDDENYNDPAFMACIDDLNQKKRHQIYLAAQGITQKWQMNRDYLSPAYTSKWSDIPLVR